MRPSTYKPTSTTTQTCPDTSTIRKFAPPAGTAAFMLSVETNDVRMTLDGTDPTAGAGSHVFPKAQVPTLVLLGSGCAPWAVSTAAGNSIVNITWLQ